MRLPLRLLILVLAFAGAGKARAQLTWTGNGNGHLKDGSNYSHEHGPNGDGVQDEDVDFTGEGTISSVIDSADLAGLSNILILHNLNFGLASPTYTFSGVGSPTLKLTGNMTVSVTNPNPIVFGSSLALTLTGGNHEFNIATGSEIKIESVVSGTGNVVKSGDGTLRLNGQNTYSGSTTVNAGVISVTSLANGGSNSGIGASSNAAGNLVLNGGTLAFTGTSGASTDRLFTIGTNGGGLDSSASGTLMFTNLGTIALSGTNTARTFKLSGTSSGYLYSVLGDNGTGKTSLTKDGTGTWTLAGNNTYTGSTTINAGTLQYQTSNALSSLTDVIVASGANLNLSYYNATIGSLAGAGTVAMNGGEGSTTLTVGGSNQTTTFSGTITGTSSNKLEKTGTGTLTLTGANTYARGTEIKGGMLVAGNNQAFGSSGSVTLNGGGLSVASGVTVNNTLIFSGTANVLAGNGTIGTAITADGHNVLSPGNLIGKLTFSAGLTLASGSAISFQIQDATGAAGVGYDLISVTGGVLNLTATSNTITFNLNSLNSDGNSGNASNFNSGNSYSWTFASSPNANITGFNPNQFHLVTNFTNSLNGGSFSFTQSLDQRSLFVNFTPVPEPSTWWMLGTGLGALALKLRRRRSV